jgi:hypothetical protein
MNLVCPICQAEYPLAAAMNDVAARQAVVKAFSLTQMGDRLIAYVTLFKPAKQALSMVRLAKLLDGLVDMVKLGQIKKNGNTYAAPQAYWINAIDQMLSNRAALSLPLKNHNYLLAIIANQSEKQLADAEKKAEQGRQFGAPNTVAVAATLKPAQRSEMPDEVRKTIKKLTGKGKNAD